MSSDNDIVVAVFAAHAEAEEAVKKLQAYGFAMKKLSIVARKPHAEEHVVRFYNAGGRMKHWGKAAFWGGLLGMLLGAAFFSIPGIGPVLVAGPLLTWIIIGGLEGTAVVGGVSAIGAGLFSVGVPKDGVLKYKIALKTDRFLLLFHGTADEAAGARRIVEGINPAGLHAYPLRPAGQREPVHAIMSE